ncbi:MAG: hypothetical protein JWP61_59 [Friedmanniella sp.]|nr:hypothetical protein [Friedmanniella sp.]
MTVTTDLPAPTAPAPSLALKGGGTGAAMMLALMFLYQLFRIGFHIAGTVTEHPGSSAAPDSADRIFGVYVIGGLLSMAPAALAGGVVGAVLGGLLSRRRATKGPVRAWFTGTALSYVVALVVNGSVLVRHRKTPLTYDRWLHLLGYPSVIFVLAFGALGAWLYFVHRQDTRPNIDLQPGNLTRA